MIKSKRRLSLELQSDRTYSAKMREEERKGKRTKKSQKESREERLTKKDKSHRPDLLVGFPHSSAS